MTTKHTIYNIDLETSPHTDVDDAEPISLQGKTVRAAVYLTLNSYPHVIIDFTDGSRFTVQEEGQAGSISLSLVAPEEHISEEVLAIVQDLINPPTFEQLAVVQRHLAHNVKHIARKDFQAWCLAHAQFIMAALGPIGGKSRKGK